MVICFNSFVQEILIVLVTLPHATFFTGKDSHQSFHDIHNTVMIWINALKLSSTFNSNKSPLQSHECRLIHYFTNYHNSPK